MNCRAAFFAAAVGLLTAGCGSGAPAVSPPVSAATTGSSASAVVPGGTSGPAGTDAGYNDTDVMFLQMMIARESETSQLTQPKRSQRLPAEVSTLVAAIRATQADEARIMKGWLVEWKRPTQMAPNASAHTHHGGLKQLSPADLADLDQTEPSEYVTRFLNLLIAQQHNAVELARMEIDTGTDPHVRDLARRIDQSRTAQITAMLTMVADR